MAFSKALDDRYDHTPKSGFNLVGIDSFEMFGEQLYLISHHDTYEEALKAEKLRKKDYPKEDTVIYPTD